MSSNLLLFHEIDKLLTVLQSNMYQELQGKSEDNPQICLKLFEKIVVVIPTKLIQITRTCFYGRIQYQYNTLEYAIPGLWSATF